MDYNKENIEENVEPKQDIINWEDTLCKQVLDEWDKGRSYVSHLDDLYDDIYKMLIGERPEKTYDWQSNIVINKVFQIIWTAIPYIVQKIFGATPLIGVKSLDRKGAWQRETILDFWHTLQVSGNSNHIPFFLIIVMWTLKGLLNGAGFLKKTYNQKLQTKTIEQQVAVPMAMDEEGNETKVEPYTTKKKITIPIEDWPYNRVVNNKDIVVDWLLQPTQSVNQGRFVIERAIVDLDSLYRSKIKYFNLDKINPEEVSTDSTLRQDHSELTGTFGQETPPESDIYTDIEIYERQGTLPVYRNNGKYIPCFDKDIIYSDKDVLFKQMVVTIAKNGSQNVLIRFEPNPYNEITYIDLHIYLDSERWSSIGMIEPIKDMQIAINDNINAMFDEIWQNLMPPVVVNKFALWDWDTMVYAPQQRWLVGGPPNDAIYFKEPSNITRDAWQKHILLDNELQLTSAITPPMQGMGKEKAATTNVLNAQMASGKLDFLVRMIEITGLIPSAQMDIRFAKKFAHPLTFQTILGEPFQFSDWEEIYKYFPVASSVKLEQQKEVETQQDIQLIQTFSAINNPNVPKVLNVLWANILRNRGLPKEAAMFDEEFYEPASETGKIQMLRKMLGGNVPSNEQQIPMSTAEKETRSSTYSPKGVYE